MDAPTEKMSDLLCAKCGIRQRYRNRNSCLSCSEEARTSRKRVTPGRAGKHRESIKDLDQAVLELTRAKDEMVAIEALQESKQRRDAMLIEALARVDLTRRYLVETLRRHGWRAASLGDDD